MDACRESIRAEYIGAGASLLVLAIILVGVPGAWFLTRPVRFVNGA